MLFYKFLIYVYQNLERLRTIAIETFKIIHKQSPSYLHDLISIKDQKYNFRHQDKAVLPRVPSTRYGLNSFRYNAAQIWNELPNNSNRHKLQKQISTEQKQAKNKRLMHLSSNRK
jgi:hypothetical protein